MGRRLFKLAAELGLTTGTIHDLALELPTRRVDILAARAPDHGQDVRIEQDLLERADRRLAGTRELGAVERIERNQIDLRRQAPHQLDQLTRMLGFVVDALEHRVFERDRRARATRCVTRACREQFVDRIFLVERHELSAQLIVRRVQRNRERYVAGFRQFVDHRHKTGRRQRDALVGKTETKIVAHHAHRTHDVVKIEERLAHAHHDDVGELALLVGHVAEMFGGDEYLADDLGGREIPVEALRARRAERAGESAADLR
jgi:hypothetical protein